MREESYINTWIKESQVCSLCSAAHTAEQQAWQFSGCGQMPMEGSAEHSACSQGDANPTLTMHLFAGNKKHMARNAKVRACSGEITHAVCKQQCVAGGCQWAAPAATPLWTACRGRCARALRRRAPQPRCLAGCPARRPGARPGSAAAASPAWQRPASPTHGARRAGLTTIETTCTRSLVMCTHKPLYTAASPASNPCNWLGRHLLGLRDAPPSLDH